MQPLAGRITSAPVPHDEALAARYSAELAAKCASDPGLAESARAADRQSESGRAAGRRVRLFALSHQPDHGGPSRAFRLPGHRAGSNISAISGRRSARDGQCRAPGPCDGAAAPGQEAPRPRHRAGRSRRRLGCRPGDGGADGWRGHAARRGRALSAARRGAARATSSPPIRGAPRRPAAISCSAWASTARAS